jgi:CubicO group peptidase (beta-lactamase class C family)
VSAQPNRGNRIALLLVVLSAAAAAGEARVAGSNATDIDVLLRNAVEQKRVPMVVAMVADANRVVYEQALGVDKDAIFAIASMTKPVTSVAVMQLVESGRVKLDDPAATYVPELATIRVRERATLRAPKSAPTVRQLLTHTAGFAYEFLNREAADAVAKKEVPSAFGGGEGFLKAPLVFDPGTHWQYGINTDWLGRLASAAARWMHISGRRFSLPWGWRTHSSSCRQTSSDAW